MLDVEIKIVHVDFVCTWYKCDATFIWRGCNFNVYFCVFPSYFRFSLHTFSLLNIWICTLFPFFSIRMCIFSWGKMFLFERTMQRAEVRFLLWVALLSLLLLLFFFFCSCCCLTFNSRRLLGHWQTVRQKYTQLLCKH